MTFSPIAAKPDAAVPFVVVCRPKSGWTLDDMRRRLRLENVRDCQPEAGTQLRISRTLKARGFKVYSDSSSSVVSAAGTAKQFQELFKTTLQRYRLDQGKSRSHNSHEFCGISPSAPAANMEILPDAILVTPVQPTCETSAELPAFPRATSSFNLRHPVDIALLTRAALVHRKLLSGQRATGSGVRIAMVDTGFYPHSFYESNGYRLSTDRAADVTTPATEDTIGHGTRQAINIFSCAPDAEVIGIKKGSNAILALDRAAALSAKIITCSWNFDLKRSKVLPDTHLPMRLTILNLISSGIPMVFSAGNRGEISFPAMMPEVIAVGGVSAHQDETLRAWSGGSSFMSRVFANRAVPDLCGLSSKMALPSSPDSDPSGPGWEITEGMTSAAAPQIAGVIALLLQKDPTLSPQQIKKILCKTASDIFKGRTATHQRALAGDDRATGSGLVDALKAWESI
jgi:subtilisin family serine protease